MKRSRQDVKTGVEADRSAAGKWLARRDRVRVRPHGLKLGPAYGAKGQEFSRLIIIMDCGEWRSGNEDERRLQYVAMTRAANL